MLSSRVAWLPRSPEHLDAARYPATDSTFEWANEIMALEQLVVEGFQLKPLRKVLEGKGAKAESSWASLRLLGAILVATGLTEDQAKTTLTHGFTTLFPKAHVVPNPHGCESGVYDFICGFTTLITRNSAPAKRMPVIRPSRSWQGFWACPHPSPAHRPCLRARSARACG